MQFRHLARHAVRWVADAPSTLLASSRIAVVGLEARKEITTCDITAWLAADAEAGWANVGI
jgi:hypothetical protein